MPKQPEKVSGHRLTDHFVGVNKMVNLGPGCH